jgi:MFS family permease
MALAAFTWLELRVEEPILQVSLFKMRVFSVSAVVTLITGFAMMGSLFYIPLFVQGVIGSSATNSGLVTMPMMITMAISSAISGQIMSRLGRYKVLGIVGLMIMVAGMVVLSRLDVDSTRRDVTMAMVIFGVGLGTSIPLFMLAVQNAVPYRVMGSSTSAMQFLRSVGATMGVAVMFTVIHNTYHDGIVASAPAAVTSQPQLAEALGDPQFLLNGQALLQLQGAFQQFGADGQLLFEQTILTVRTSLADGITDAFFVSALVLMAAVAAAFFMKELPMRSTHMTEEAPQPDAVVPPAPRLLPADGGTVGLDQVYP